MNWVCGAYAGAPAWDESVLPLARISQVATWAKELERELRGAEERAGKGGGLSGGDPSLFRPSLP